MNNLSCVPVLFLGGSKCFVLLWSTLLATPLLRGMYWQTTRFRVGFPPQTGFLAVGSPEHRPVLGTASRAFPGFTFATSHPSHKPGYQIRRPPSWSGVCDCNQSDQTKQALPPPADHASLAPFHRQAAMAPLLLPAWTSPIQQAARWQHYQMTVRSVGGAVQQASERWHCLCRQCRVRPERWEMRGSR
ncbi:uncharacterized protein BKA78DRAFT_108506 [Phyllosticta capitalensis]|uniref:uncharacterized protein n=1 Tax=Phyllosticta capitalensis TaxID=121624 RepID=UPI0031326137